MIDPKFEHVYKKKNHTAEVHGGRALGAAAGTADCGPNCAKVIIAGVGAGPSPGEPAVGGTVVGAVGETVAGDAAAVLEGESAGAARPRMILERNLMAVVESMTTKDKARSEKTKTLYACQILVGNKNSTYARAWMHTRKLAECVQI
jgi:hypothetical protein